MTRDMKDELLLVMLFFGLDSFLEFLLPEVTSSGFSSPNAGAVDFDALILPLVGVLPPSLLISADGRPSFGCSRMGAGTRDSVLNL